MEAALELVWPLPRRLLILVRMLSLRAVHLIKGLSAIAAANGAVEALARSLAVELGPIRVNTVLPAVISTPQYDRMLDDKRKKYLEHYGAKLPVKRPGNPDDVAATVLYLILNAHTTGTLAEVNGGYQLV